MNGYHDSIARRGRGLEWTGEDDDGSLESGELSVDVREFFYCLNLTSYSI
jgi:hypothetical protein